MEKPDKDPGCRAVSLEKSLTRLRRQLETFDAIIAKREPDPDLGDFDAETEEMIGEIFGSPSEMLEAYSYAEMGEASGLINLPEEAQDPGEQDIEHESLHQRRRVLERCIAELESRRRK